MAKGKLPLIIGLTAATITLSACIAKVWEASFPGINNDYSRFYDIAFTNNINPVVMGQTVTDDDQHAAIVVQYDNNGNLLWHHNFPGFMHFGLPGENSYIATDSQNNVIFSAATQDIPFSPSLFAKINSDGQIEWEKHIDGHDFAIPSDLVITPDDTYLLLNGSTVTAFSPEGSELWSYTPTQPCGPGCELGGETNEIPNDNLDNYLSGPGTPPFFPGAGEIASLMNVNIALRINDSIHILNEQGVFLVELSAANLGLTGITDFDGGENHLVILGQGEAGLKTIILDDELGIVDELDTTSSGNGIVSTNASGAVCVATMNNNQLTVYNMTPKGAARFESTREASLLAIIGLDNNNDDNTCYVSLFEEGSSVHQTTLLISDNAILKDTLRITDFASEAVKVKASYVYSAGITESAETSSGTIGSLFKHQVR